MKTLNIGDRIRINKNPITWSSEFSNNNPIGVNFKYPVVGIVKNKKDCIGFTGLLIEIDGKEYGFSEETLLDVCELLPKLDKLPQEYIVKCENMEETTKVVNTLHPNSGKNRWSHWNYVIKYKHTERDSNEGVNIFNIIPNEYKHLPVLLFNEWKELYYNKETNDIANKTKTMESKEFVKVINAGKSYSQRQDAKELGCTKYHFWLNKPIAKNGDILEIVKEFISWNVETCYILKDNEGIEYIIQTIGCEKINYNELKGLKENLEAELKHIEETFKHLKPKVTPVKVVMPHYKIDDIVVCLPGFNDNNAYGKIYGGAGYESGLIFKIISIDYYSPSRDVLWRNSKDVYDNAVRYATQEEKKNFNERNITISGYNAEIYENDKFVEFGCKSITLKTLTTLHDIFIVSHHGKVCEGTVEMICSKGVILKIDDKFKSIKWKNVIENKTKEIKNDCSR